MACWVRFVGQCEDRIRRTAPRPTCHRHAVARAAVFLFGGAHHTRQRRLRRVGGGGSIQVAHVGRLSATPPDHAAAACCTRPRQPHLNSTPPNRKRTLQPHVKHHPLNSLTHTHTHPTKPQPKHKHTTKQTTEHKQQTNKNKNNKQHNTTNKQGRVPRQHERQGLCAQEEQVPAQDLRVGQHARQRPDHPLLR